MTEKFSLKWNDYHSNVASSFGALRNEDYLCDVTLISDNQQQAAAHRLVLSACSEYFQDIFRNNRSPNLMLCLEGINRNDLNKFLESNKIFTYQDHFRAEKLKSIFIKSI